MAEYNLGTARGRVVIDYDGKGVAQAKQGIEGVGLTSEQADRKIGQLGTGMGIAGAAIVAGLGVAAKSAADFEKRLSGIEAVSGATGAQMDAIRDKALQLGKDTAFSAGESALAIEELAKAGLSLDEIMGGAADATVALAAAGEVDLVTAATIASNAMNQFGLSAGDLVNVSDKIAGAANASAIDVNDFGQSLQQVGAVANLAGVSFDDTAAAIALLGNAGIKGSDAGTSLKTMLNNLQPSTEKQAGLFKELGLITEDGANQFYDAEGRLKSLSEVSGILQSSLAGLTDQQKQAALETLFGSDAIRAAAVLAKEGSAGFDALATSMGKTSAADIAKTRMDNLAGRVEELKGSLETLGITLGTIIIPALTKIAEKLIEAANWFLELSPATQKAIVIFAAFAASALLLGAAVIKIAMFVKNLQMVFMALKSLAFLRTFLTFLFGPWGLAIAAVIALAFLIYKNWDTIKALLLTVWEAIVSGFSAAWAFITDLFNSFTSTISDIWNTTLTAIMDVWNTVWEAVVGVIQAIVDVIVGIISTYVNIWLTIITTVLNAIKAVFDAVWGVIGGLIKAVWDLIVAIVELGLKLIKLYISTVLFVIQTIFETVWNAIKSVVTTVLGAIKSVIMAVWGFIGPYIMGALDGIKSGINAAWEFIKSVTSSAFNAVSGVVSSVWNSITGFISGAIDRIKGVISGLASIAGTVGGYFADMFDAAKEKVEQLISFVGGIAGRVTSAVGDLGKLLFDAGKDIIQGLIDGVAKMIGKLTEKLNFITNLIPDIKGPARKDRILLEDNGKLIMEGLIGGIESQVPALTRVLGGLTTSIPVTVGAGVVPAAPARTAAAAPVGDSYTIGSIEIPARDLAEMQTVTDFLGRIQQEARKRVPARGGV